MGAIIFRVSMRWGLGTNPHPRPNKGWVTYLPGGYMAMTNYDYLEPTTPKAIDPLTQTLPSSLPRRHLTYRYGTGVITFILFLIHYLRCT